MSRQEEDAIERVLTGIREAEVPEGLERRVLARLREHADAGAARSSVWQVRVWAAAVGVAVVMGVIWVSAARHGRSVELKRDAVVETPLALPEKEPSVEVVRREVTRRARPQPVVRKVVDAQAELALSETQAPSMVAPEMPLTEQERLLLRVAHKGDPEEVAMLNPATREERNTAERAQVEHFFERTKFERAKGESE